MFEVQIRSNRNNSLSHVWSTNSSWLLEIILASMSGRWRNVVSTIASQPGGLGFDFTWGSIEKKKKQPQGLIKSKLGTTWKRENLGGPDEIYCITHWVPSKSIQVWVLDHVSNLFQPWKKSCFIFECKCKLNVGTELYYLCFSLKKVQGFLNLILIFAYDFSLSVNWESNISNKIVT